MTDQPITQRIAMKAIIVHNGTFLVVREASTYQEGTNLGKWQLPGGRINPGEPFLDGLKREIKEETGLDVTVGDPVYVGEWFPVIKDVPNQIVGVFFICTPLTDEVVLSEEHDTYQWVTPQAYANLTTVSSEKGAIEAFARSVQ